MLAIKLDTRYRFNFIRNLEFIRILLLSWSFSFFPLPPPPQFNYFPSSSSFFLYSSLHLHYDPIGPFIDPSSTLRRPYTLFFFNTAS